MEVINVPLAASTAGLVLAAARARRPPPRGALWAAVSAVVISAVVALVPVIPGMMVRFAAMNHWPTTLAQALTSGEDTPLYAVSTLTGLSLCVAWAAALTWYAPGPSFYRHVVRAITY